MLNWHVACRSSIQIFVQCLTGKTITIDVEEENTLEVVRRKIQDKIGVSSDEHWLLYGATVLNDTCTLAQHHITREATHYLRARLSVGFEFANLQQPREVQLGTLGPSWRALRNGLNFVGPCLSSTCEARLQVVAMKVGMGRCDVARALRQFNHCPECNACVVISGCILYACEWEFRGCKIDEETETVVKGIQPASSALLFSGLGSDRRCWWSYLEITAQRLSCKFVSRGLPTRLP